MSSSIDFGRTLNGFQDKIEIRIEDEDEEKEEIVYGKRSRGKLGRRKESCGDEDSQFKSKNLHAERRRRARLSSNLLQLRTLVPIITNMNKDMIVKDAITYIQVLQKEVKKLSDELSEMEASDAEEETKVPRDSAVDICDQMDKLEIEPDVKVITMGEHKLWMKVIFAKRIGRLTQIMEAIDGFGYQMTDTSFTTTRGAATFTSCLEEMFGAFRSEEETREMLLGIIGSN